MSESIPEIDAEAFEREVLGADGPVVVDFYSTECPPCEALAPKYEALAGEYGGDIRFLKIFRQGNRALADRLNVRSSPTLLFFANGAEVGERLTGGIHRAAIERQLDALLPAERVAAIDGARTHTRTECDVVVVGAGPAGLTAAIYCAQARLRTIVVDRALGGGNMALTHRVSNYPGFPEPQPGYMLAHLMTEHAKAAGAELRLAVDLTEVDLERREVVVDGVETIHARKLVLATGSSPRPLGIEGEVEYRGRGVSYCATCDAKYYEGRHVVVIGGGNSALQESQLIAKYAAKVTIVHQFDRFTATQELQEAVLGDPKFEVLFQHEPRAFVAKDGAVGGVLLEDLRTHERRLVECDGAFVFAGMRPNLDGLGDGFALDEFGYVRVDPEMRTSLEGVYAAGDVRSKRFRQMTTAVSDGTVAAMAITGELAG